MVDVTFKEAVYRSAVAVGSIRLKPSTVKAIREKAIPKGDPLTVAMVAAVSAAKDTSRIIPLCHPVPITDVKVSPEVTDEGVRVRVMVKSTGKTGVEMEALTAVSVYLLTVWDMVKSMEKDDRGQYPDTVIAEVRVEEKVKL
ncbi:MAG: cyclic pyranopterin monophosphate synthase MoaC [Candidatus Bathyarchaeia archaeon]|nr:cyclic pyranopterin monophosphate synthase MoaC [Candidatus Bathyarchaeota archaeon]